MRILLIDDKRSFTRFDDEMVIFINVSKSFRCTLKDEILQARTYEGGLMALRQGPWDVLLLDNDLGEEKEGHQILEYLEFKVATHLVYELPGKSIPVTANPVAYTRMETIIKRLYDKT